MEVLWKLASETELAQVAGAVCRPHRLLLKENSAPKKSQMFSLKQHQGAICGLPLGIQGQVDAGRKFAMAVLWKVLGPNNLSEVLLTIKTGACQGHSMWLQA